MEIRSLVSFIIQRSENLVDCLVDFESPNLSTENLVDFQSLTKNLVDCLVVDCLVDCLVDFQSLDGRTENLMDFQSLRLRNENLVDCLVVDCQHLICIKISINIYCIKIVEEKDLLAPIALPCCGLPTSNMH
ncbi:hypothetical protein A2U01_0037983 [Trifolium medium]|uniref:Uncharacterized protein n=1 Tax=Trifolium medium TaxID=97028 RepID=A0A392PZ63_9FABA|nr:hypothetical protein [Trifolium medium]